MDWASTQWKEGLPSIALQKVSLLEEKIEKLQKERQQKQHQFDCLELTLSKEKRKGEEGKQQIVQLERELQFLGDTCKTLESKHQKLQAEIQNRDSRINNLEGQLSLSKKQNSRLQQLENDIEELRCLKENAKLENKQLEKKLMMEQSTIVKQSDAISDLEQTVRSLQEKCSNTENSVLLNEADKENISILNNSSKDNLPSETLRKKISEQEKTIKSLQEQLAQISGSKDKPLPPANDIFSTPARGKNSSSDANLSSAKKSFSYWDNFGSTPSKSGKLAKHINDSSTFDNDSNEKVHSLQLKLKQVCQELECQRHNFEASKSLMEQKFKEKETTLKTEMKHQAQTIFDFDKELKELKNKYQQDVVQASKKLDLVNGQLQKSELSKQQMEKDLKALENQISSKNNSLLQKEEELKDVLKLKSSLEATTKSLQSEKRELERNCSALTTQKNSLTEEIRDLKIQLDGSNNLVKEKETVICNLKKEQNSSLKIKSDLEGKIQSINKDLSVVQSEKDILEKQLQKLHAEISVLKNNAESMKEENKKVCSTLDLEKSRSEKLKCDLENKEKEIITLQSEIKSNEHNIMSLQDDLKQVTDDCNVKIKDMEQKLSKSDEDNSYLKNQLQTYSDNKKIMENNMAELAKEIERISDLLATKVSESETFRKEIENMESKLQSVQRDNDAKSENISCLEEKIKSDKEAYEKQLKELNETVSLLSTEKANFETLLKDQGIKVESLKSTILETETEKQNLLELLTAEKEKTGILDTELSELKKTLQNMRLELSNKIVKLSDVLKNLNIIESEKAELETNLKNCGDREESLQKTLLQIETDKQSLSDLLNAEKVKAESLQLNIVELQKKINDQQVELSIKDSSINDLNKNIEDSKEDVCKMNEIISAIKSENVLLQNKLKDLAVSEESLQAELLQNKTEKQKLSELLNEEMEKSKVYQLSISESEKILINLQTELDLKISTIDDLKRSIEELKQKTSEMDESITAINAEKLSLEKNLKDSAVKEKSLEDNLVQLETEKQHCMDLLKEEKKKSDHFQSNLTQCQEEIGNLQAELNLRGSTVDGLNKTVEELKAKACEISGNIDVIQAEKTSLEKNLMEYVIKEEELQKRLMEVETDKQELLELSTAEKKKAEVFQLDATELKNKVEELEEHLKTKELAITDLGKSVEVYKEKSSEMEENITAMKSEKMYLENSMKDSVLREESLKNCLQTIEADKQNLLDLLTTEKERSDALQLQVTELTKKVADLHTNLDIKETTIDNQNKSIGELKTKLCDLNEDITSIKSEKLVVEKELNEIAMKLESLQKNLVQVENEKKSVDELLNAEKSKAEALELNLSEMKLKLDTFGDELDSRDTNIELLNKKMEELKSYEDHVQRLEKELSVFCEKEISLNEKIKQLEEEKISSNELLSAEKNKSLVLEGNVNEFQAKVASLESELKMTNETLSSFRSDIATSKEIYELKLKEFETTLEATKSENDNLSNQLKDFIQNENILKDSIEKMEAEKKSFSDILLSETKKTEVLQINIEELKANLLTTDSESYSKDRCISNLKTEIEAMRETHKKENASLNMYIEDVKCTLLSMQDSVKIIYSKNDFIQNEISNLKKDYQELQMQKTCDQQSREKFLHGLLNQVNVIERHVEALNENYEEEISTLKTTLLNTELRTSLQAEDYNILMDENAKLQEDLISFQEKVLERDRELKRALLIENEHFNCLKTIEDLKSAQENLHQVNYQLKEEVSTLKTTLWNTELKIALQTEDYDILLNEKVKLQEQLISVQENILEKEMELKSAVSIKSEHFNCVKNIEDLKNAQENLYKENYQLKEDISTLKTTLWNTELKIALQTEDYDILLNEKVKLQEQLISVQENILEKEMELKSAVLIKSEHFNCVKSIEDLKNAQENLYKENYQLKEEISTLKTTLWNFELKVALQTEDYDILMKEKTKLQEESISTQDQIQDYCILKDERSKLVTELEITRDKLLEKELELENASLIESKHANCTENIKNLMEDKESLTQENCHLQKQVSDLQTDLAKAETKIVSQNEECSIFLEEKSNLLSELQKLVTELEVTRDKLLEKELELENASLIESKHANCTENIKNLMDDKESLTQENCHLQKQVFDLQTDLAKAETKIVSQNEECNIHLEEKSNLLSELQIVKNKLCDKETSLKNAILVENEHKNCLKTIENLTNAKEILSEENGHLQAQLSNLKKILSETESKATIQTEEYDILSKEKSSLLEELNIVQGKLCAKELEFENAVLIEKEHSECAKSIENLTAANTNLLLESTELQTRISSTCEDLKIAKERLCFLDNKLKNIILKCKNMFSSIKELQEQEEKLSLDLIDITGDYCMIDNKTVSDRNEVEDMCDLVLQCINLLGEYVSTRSRTLEIPPKVCEIGNHYFHKKTTETSNSSVVLQNEGTSSLLSSDCQNLQRNMAKDLSALSVEAYSLLSLLEERILNQKERFKFLVHHQLIENDDFKKMLATLEFMRKVYIRICLRKPALQALQDFKLYLFSQNQSSEEIASIINLFSNDFNEDSDVHSFFEKCLLVNSYKNIYMACKLKKVLCLVRDQLNASFKKFENFGRYFERYQNIHNHSSHMPVLIKTEHIIYFHSLASLCYEEKLICKMSCLRKNREQPFCMNSILSGVKTSIVPLILNSMFELYEKSSSYSVYKNLVCFLMKSLQSCCLKGVSFFSYDTVRIFERFLHFMSRVHTSEFKKIILQSQMNALGDLLSSLLQDFSNVKHLVYTDEQELEKNRNLLGVMSDELKKLKFEYENKHKELNVLQSLLQEERNNHKDLSIMLLQKEKWEKNVLEMSKLCSALKNIFSENSDILNLQSEIANLSDTFCLCQTCLTEQEVSGEKSSNHVLFTPVTLIHFIAELFTSKSDYEKEVLKLEECKSTMRQEIIELENEKMFLQQTVDDLEGSVNSLKHELGNMKSKYSCLENEYQNLNSLYNESNEIREDQQNCIKTNREEIRTCKEQYEELLSEYQKVINDLSEKGEEISNYEKVIQDKTSKYEILDVKCKKCETEIENLKTTITKLTNIKETEESNISLITDMKNKIASLEKSNNLLNMTVESVEEELQSTYAEKLTIQEKLQEKQDEIENLQREIASWKNEITEQRNEVSSLEQTTQELRKEIESAETKCSELLIENSKLQSDVTLLEQSKTNHETLLIQKNSCIQQNSLIINQLKERILVISDEMKNIESSKLETEAKLKCELQSKDTFLFDLERKLNLVLKEKTDLEKQISNLLLSEEERTRAQQEKESSDQKCKELIEEVVLLRSKLENFELQVSIAEKEQEKAVQSIQDLNFEKEKCIKELNALNEELSFAKKSNVESSVLIQQLEKKLKDNLELCEKAKVLMDENDILNKAVDNLKTQSSAECNCKKSSSVLDISLVKSENVYKECVTKIINLLIMVIRDIEYGNDSDKTNLISLLSKWESNINNPSYFTSEIRLKLQSVLEYQLSKQKELEFNLCNLKEFICEFTTELHQYFESEENTNKLTCTMLGDKSCFEESLCISFAKNQTYFVLNSFVSDLKNSFKMLESYFNSMKDIIYNKDLEIKSLREIENKENAKAEMKTGQNEKQSADYLIMKNKCKMLISNAYRLEKSYHKLQKANEDLEARIKHLEQEKLELNAEADEMAEIIKQQNSSDELTNLYKKLSESSKEMLDLKEKNQCLKVILEQYLDIIKEHGINISAAS